MLRLLLPTTKYIAGVKKAYQEQYQLEEISEKIWFEIKSELKNPHTFVKTIRDKSKGVGLALDQPPLIRYWLIDNNEYIGTLRLSKKITQKMKYQEGHIGYQIRPSKRKQGYGTIILRLGLLKAKKEGLKKVFINCSKDNIGSQKIIEKSNGKLITAPEGEKDTLYYVIDMK